MARFAQSGRRFRLTLDHVWLAAALALLALRPLLMPIAPNDFWWHLATGRSIVAQAGIPSVDSFSYTQAGQPFFNQGWLAELLMYGLFEVGGLPLLLLFQALVIVLAYGLLLRLCIIRSGRLRLSVVLLMLSLPLAFSNWTIRPQSYTFPLFVGFLTILTEYRLGRTNRLWLLPLLMTLWVNMHGAFVLGLAMIGITFLGEALRRRTTDDERRTTDDGQRASSSPVPSSQFSVLGSLAFWGALTGLATLINPRGYGVLAYVRNLVGSSSVTQLVEEWAPPTIRDADGSGLIFFLFLIALVAVLVYARRRPDLTDMLLCGAFLWLALGATRNIVWFGLVALPLFAAQAATLLPAPGVRRSSGSSVLNGVLIGLLGLLLLLGLPWVKPVLLPPPIGSLLTEDTPVAAVEHLRAAPMRPRHLFHTEAYGSYLMWAAPEQPVFIDTRIELYPYQQWLDYINLGQANNTAALFRKYAIDGLLLNKERQAGLVGAVRGDSAWQIVYEDDRVIYLLKRGSG